MRFTSPAESLVEKNVFRQRSATLGTIPRFEDVRPCLPTPVLPEDNEWEELYWKAWESYWRSLQLPQSGSSLIAGYHRPKEDNNIEMGQTALLENLAGYIYGSYSAAPSLDNFYAAQHDDGFIPRELHPTNGKDIHQPYEPNSTGPNILAWTEWRNFR